MERGDDKAGFELIRRCRMSRRLLDHRKKQPMTKAPTAGVASSATRSRASATAVGNMPNTGTAGRLLAWPFHSVKVAI